MAEASTEDAALPQTNGIIDNEDDEKSKMRPADIDADVREMERRKRVEMIMSSKLFREELERIIESQMKEGGGPAGLIQQIQDMVGGAGRFHSGTIFKSSNCVVPINDIRGVESAGYAKGEKILRCKLASVFRLMDLYGWNHGIQSHITARLNQEEEHFIVNPFGLMYHEVTASSLVKVDMQGSIVEPGTTNFGVNSVRFHLHAAVHAARPDLKCVIHVHTPSVLAVSSLKCGLLPLCQESAVIGEVSQHLYLGSLTEPEEKDKIARNLGPNNKVMLLSNHGAVCCGETVEEAFFNVYNTVLACETQAKLLPLGVDNLILLPDESRKLIYDAARKAPEGWGPVNAQPLPAALEKKEKKWRVGGMEFEALMRMLDNAGFRTGYIYRTPLVKGDPPKPRNDVEVPPAVSSLGYLLEEEEMYKQGQWKKGVYSKSDRTRWLNSPNVYQKVEILETGTTDPKKITKWVDANNYEWVADGSPTHSSTPVKIDAALQFVPKNTNPKEFKKLQQQIKENRRADKITSGPQSHILEGLSWEEAKKLQDANISMTGDQVIMLGTASKGIIQRGFQHNATVYKTPYAKNPFDHVSDQELEDYKKVINKKQKGDFYDEDQSESEALSSSAALPPSGIKSPHSETEEDSRTEPQVLRIETKTAPVASQAEVVLSDESQVFPVTCSILEIESRAEVARIVEVRKTASESLLRVQTTAQLVSKDKFTQTLANGSVEDDSLNYNSFEDRKTQMSRVIEELSASFSKWGKQIENSNLKCGTFGTSSPVVDNRQSIAGEAPRLTDLCLSTLNENGCSSFNSSNSTPNKTYSRRGSQPNMDEVIAELSNRLSARNSDAPQISVQNDVLPQVSARGDDKSQLNNSNVDTVPTEENVIEEVSVIISSSVRAQLNMPRLDGNGGDFMSDDDDEAAPPKGEQPVEEVGKKSSEQEVKARAELTNPFIGEDYERGEDLETGAPLNNNNHYTEMSYEMSTSFSDTKYIQIIRRLDTIFEEYCDAELPRPGPLIVKRRAVP